MKNHHHQPRAEPTDNSRRAIHAAIANRAYEIWEGNGKPENQADAHWLEAELEQVTGKRAVRAEVALPISF